MSGRRGARLPAEQRMRLSLCPADPYADRNGPGRDINHHSHAYGFPHAVAPELSG